MPHLLLLEDDADIRLGLEQHLQREGFTISALENALSNAERRAILPWTLAELSEQLARGRAGAADLPPAGPIDLDRATATVLDAFRDGLVVLIVDGRRCVNLNAPLDIHADTRFTLLRRAMLQS